MSKITTAQCIESGCVQLRRWEENGRMVRRCNVTGRIVGNMPRCPMDAGR